MNLENRVVNLEARLKPKPDIHERARQLERACAHLSGAEWRERQKQFLYRCTDAELLQLCGLPPDATLSEIEAVARQPASACSQNGY